MSAKQRGNLSDLQMATVNAIRLVGIPTNFINMEMYLPILRSGRGPLMDGAEVTLPYEW